MAEEILIEMAPEERRQPFWKKPKVLAALIGIAAVIFAGLFSWWLANGTVSSLQARMDTSVYIVEPEFNSRVRAILVRPGQEVQSGQVIGALELPAEPSGPGQGQSGLQGITDRLSAIQAAEKQMAARVSEARMEEERLQKVYQDFVTEHVRTLLALRAIRNPGSAHYQQIAAAEMAAKSRMQAANDEFEKASKARAAMDVELNKIRAQLQRARKGLTPDMVNNALSGQAHPPRLIDLYAPVTGSVLRVNTDSGHLVQKGQNLVTIIPTGDDYLANSWIQAMFPVSARKDLKPGQEALIRFEGEQPLKAKVKSVGGTGQGSLTGGEKQNANNYVDVRLVLDDPFKAKSIQPGAKAECQVQTRYFMGMTIF